MDYSSPETRTYNWGQFHGETYRGRIKAGSGKIMSDKEMDAYEKDLDARKAAVRAWNKAFERLTPAQKNAWKALSPDEKDATYRMTVEEFLAYMDELTRPALSPDSPEVEAIARDLLRAMHESTRKQFAHHMKGTA